MQRKRQQGDTWPLWLLCVYPVSKGVAGIDTCQAKTKCESLFLGVHVTGQPKSPTTASSHEWFCCKCAAGGQVADPPQQWSKRDFGRGGTWAGLGQRELVSGGEELPFCKVGLYQVKFCLRSVTKTSGKKSKSEENCLHVFSTGASEITQIKL